MVENIDLTILLRRNAEMEAKLNSLETGGGGGYDGGMSDLLPRVAKLEAAAEATGKRLDNIDGRLSRLDSDFRWTWGGLAASFVILATLSLTLYGKLDTRISALETSIVKIDGKVDTILSRIPDAPKLK